MAEMLLINPRRRAKKARRATKARARRRNPVKVLRKVPTVAARATNPRRRRAARRNPIGARRRRNPIGGIKGVSLSSFASMLKDAAVGGAGAIGMDMLWSRVNPYLPAVVQSVPGSLGVGTVVKAFATALIGQALSKPTKGLSRKAASGALAVQAHGALMAALPAMGLGYASPAAITQGTQRVGPIRQGVNGLRAYIKPGATPLLNAYIKPGATPLLNRFTPARDRERAIR